MAEQHDPRDDGDLLGQDVSHLPRAERLRRARTFLAQLAEDDWTQSGFVIDAAKAVAGPEAGPEAVRETAIELYLSFVDDELVTVLLPDFAHHYVDPSRVREDVTAVWQDAGVEPPIEDMPWLTWRADDRTPPGP